MDNMLLLVIFASALVSFTNGAVPKLRSPLPQLDGRIVGGEDVEIEEYPYQLSLLSYGRHLCGASIISETVAVTAAHCTFGSLASALSVRASSSIRGSGGEVVQISQIRQHPDFNFATVDYDISVLILASPLTLGPAAQPIALPEENEDVPGGTASVVSGWGALLEGGSSPLQLQAVKVPIVTQQECRAAYGSSSITDRMICAGLTQGGKDACQGDSGGPLVANGKLVGVVSWGYGCARPEYPGVYANVPNLRSFIKEVAGI